MALNSKRHRRIKVYVVLDTDANDDHLGDYALAMANDAEGDLWQGEIVSGYGWEELKDD